MKQRTEGLLDSKYTLVSKLQKVSRQQGALCKLYIDELETVGLNTKHTLKGRHMNIENIIS